MVLLGVVCCVLVVIERLLWATISRVFTSIVLLDMEDMSCDDDAGNGDDATSQ